MTGFAGLFPFLNDPCLTLLLLLDGADLLVFRFVGHGALVLVHLITEKIVRKNKKKEKKIPQSVPYHIWSPRTFCTACPENGNSQLQFAENFDKIPEHLGIRSHTLFHICPEKKINW